MFKFAIITDFAFSAVDGSMLRINTDSDINIASARLRPVSPVMNPKHFIIRSLCETPDTPKDALFRKLVRGGFPASQRGLFDESFEQVSKKTRMPRYIHQLIVSLAQGVEVERNELLLARSIDPVTDREDSERHMILWSKLCVEPLLDKRSTRGFIETPCYLDQSTDEWILSDSKAHDLFCCEYDRALLN